MPHLGLRALQKFAADGGIEKEMANLKSGTDGCSGRAWTILFPATDDQLGATLHLGGPTADEEMTNLGDGGECLAAKAERLDFEKVIGGLKLAGGVGCDGEQQLVGGNAANHYR